MAGERGLVEGVAPAAETTLRPASLTAVHWIFGEELRVHQLGANGGAGRGRFGKERSIDRVHVLKVPGVVEKNFAADDVAVAHARRLEDEAEVFEHAPGLRRHVSALGLIGVGVSRRRAGDEERRADLDAPAVGELGALHRYGLDDLFLDAGTRRDHGDLDERAGDGDVRLDGGADGRRVAEVGLVHLVHRGEMAGVGEVDVRADDPGEVHSRGVEDGAEVVHRLAELGLDALGKLESAGSVSDLPGQVEKVSGQHGRAEGEPHVHARGGDDLLLRREARGGEQE